jgi:hypothetical protein
MIPVLKLLSLLIWGLFVLLFYFAFSKRPKSQRIKGILVTELIAIGYIGLVSWMWSKTPVPNDAGEGFIVISEFSFVLCIVAAAIASMRQSNDANTGS